ncbi:Protein app1-like [Oopsacas minuta]|uniref:Protein app1-like n=1 Tax=Oopsacas minuta TaxID=111878 RepID=A0AAV7JCX0_9METZ|nr:Protein app1-like [Oopsacas minuta]
MAITAELHKLISEIQHFLTDSLAKEVLSEDSEDKRDDLSARLGQYLQSSQSKSLPRLQVPTNDPILRVKTSSNTATPELPTAPPPGQVKKVCTKDLSGSILYEGTIEKLGGKNQEKWQKRYCILTPTHLYFFENSKSKKQNNQIYIPAFTVTPVKEKGDDKHYSFRLSANKESKSYYFRVNNPDTFSQWLHNISQLSKGRDSLGVTGLVGRAETMVFNQDDVISTASSSDEGGDDKTLGTIREDSPPPPVPPPTSRLPKSPQAIKKLSSGGPPAPPNQPPPPSSQPPIILSHPGSEPPTHLVPSAPVQTPQPVRDISTPPVSNKLLEDKPPPPPTRRNTSLSSGPGVSVEQLRKIQQVQPNSIASVTEESSDSGEVVVNTDRVYVTTEEEGFPYDKIYVGKWDFKGEEGDELSFKRGELLLVADPDESSTWWIGDLLDTETLKARDQSGLFYSAYVESAFVKVT